MKNFKGLFWTQFLGAANDNFFKNALVMLIAFKGLNVWGLDAKNVVALAGGVFILPYFLFSGLAGELCGHMERSKLMRITKYAELGIMSLASLCFFLESYDSLLVVLFLMGSQSTFFSPAKYSSIIELCSEKDFVKANAYIEIGTFAAILLGTIAGGAAASFDSYLFISLVLLGMAGIGVLSSYRIPPLKILPSTKKLSFDLIRPSVDVLKVSFGNYHIRNSIYLCSLFWFLGACILSVIPVYTKDILFGDESLATFILACFTVGIGAGSFLCEKLSLKRVELGISTLGLFFSLIFLFDLFWISYPTQAPKTPYTAWSYLTNPTHFRSIADFFLLSVFLGIYAVPINTWLQKVSPDRDRSKAIAANNIINSVAMVFSAAYLIFLNSLNLSSPEIFRVLAISCFAAFVFLLYLYPTAFHRSLNYLFSFYYKNYSQHLGSIDTSRNISLWRITKKRQLAAILHLYEPGVRIYLQEGIGNAFWFGLWIPKKMRLSSWPPEDISQEERQIIVLKKDSSQTPISWTGPSFEIIDSSSKILGNEFKVQPVNL